MMKLPRENVYACEYGCRTVTVDVAKGVTPFFIKCRKKATKDRPLVPHLTGSDGECIGQAQSSFYPKSPRPPYLSAPTHEWYAPSIEELPKLSIGERDHVTRGGLLLRERTNAEPIYHGDE